MMAEVLAAGGHDVTYVTNSKPMFASDFKSYPHHRRVKVHLTPDFRVRLPLRDFDIVIMVPHPDRDPSFFLRVQAFAASRYARLATLNFETPNWFNAMSPIPRDLNAYSGWKRLCEHADMIISSAKESVKHARQYFDNLDPRTLHVDCYPSINSRVADNVTGIDTERRVLLFGRFFSQDAHKGSTQANELFCEELAGHTMVFIVGSQEFSPPQFPEWEEEAAKFDITLEMLFKLSDEQKFREIKRSRLVLFPSFFEGFGYPPIEAQYCNVPCVSFDLPVVRETSRDGVYYVPIGDWNAFQKMIGQVLRENKDHSHLKNGIVPIATFESYEARMERLISRLMEHPRRVQKNRP